MKAINWHEFLIADFESGTIRWKPRAREHFPSDRAWKIWNTRDAGEIAGSTTLQGYRRIKMFGKQYLSHRILYEMANGPIAECLQIDHIDQNKGNNALSNLRLATDTENRYNCSVRANSASGIKGVYWHKHRGRWAAAIRHNGRTMHLGLFDTKGMAAVSYAKASLRVHGRFSIYYTHSS